MAKHDKVATRYAKAVYEYLNGDKKRIERVASELHDFGECLEVSKELELALCEELLTAQQRRWIVEDLAKRLEFSHETLQTLKVICEAKRFRIARLVSEKLRAMLLQEAKVVPIRVEAAGELTQEEKNKIEKKFQTILGKNVEASYLMDPRLIGGVRVTAAGKTYDGSVAGWLSTFEEQLVGGNI